jgi:hypothetical protein
LPWKQSSFDRSGLYTREYGQIQTFYLHRKDQEPGKRRQFILTKNAGQLSEKKGNKGIKRERAKRDGPEF